MFVPSRSESVSSLEYLVHHENLEILSDTGEARSITTASITRALDEFPAVPATPTRIMDDLPDFPIRFDPAVGQLTPARPPPLVLYDEPRNRLPSPVAAAGGKRQKQRTSDWVYKQGDRGCSPIERPTTRQRSSENNILSGSQQSGRTSPPTWRRLLTGPITPCLPLLQLGPVARHDCGPIVPPTNTFGSSPGRAITTLIEPQDPMSGPQSTSPMGHAKAQPIARPAQWQSIFGFGVKGTISRKTQACERCKRKKLRCEDVEIKDGISDCKGCRKDHIPCTFSGVQKKRGPPAGGKQLKSSEQAKAGPSILPSPPPTIALDKRRSSSRSLSTSGSSLIITPDDEIRSYEFTSPQIVHPGSPPQHKFVTHAQTLSAYAHASYPKTFKGPSSSSARYPSIGPNPIDARRASCAPPHLDYHSMPSSDTRRASTTGFHDPFRQISPMPRHFRLPSHEPKVFGLSDNGTLSGAKGGTSITIDPRARMSEGGLELPPIEYLHLAGIRPSVHCRREGSI